MFFFQQKLSRKKAIKEKKTQHDLEKKKYIYTEKQAQKEVGQDYRINNIPKKNY